MIARKKSDIFDDMFLRHEPPERHPGSRVRLINIITMLITPPRAESFCAYIRASSSAFPPDGSRINFFSHRRPAGNRLDRYPLEESRE